MRLGAYKCQLVAQSLAERLYGASCITERHRHRYEVNNEYREVMAKAGMVCSGLSPDYRLVEIVEIPSHPYFIATQFHPEFRSRPNHAHPLFSGLVEASLCYRQKRPTSVVVSERETRRKNVRGELNVETADALEG